MDFVQTVYLVIVVGLIFLFVISFTVFIRRLLINSSSRVNGQTWEGIKSMIDQQLIPTMKQTGLKNVELKNGQNSRKFQTVAVVGEK